MSNIASKPSLAVVPGREIVLLYTQANVTNQKMGLVTLTTVANIKEKPLRMSEQPYGVLVENDQGSMLIPYTNIRCIVYK